MKPIPHKTKIICTLGPASKSYEMIKSLVLAGMDIARLNFSYGTYSEFSRIISDIRRIEKELRAPIGILQDLQGPKIRLGKLLEPMEIIEGEKYFFTNGKIKIQTSSGIPILYPRLNKDLDRGDQILTGDGPSFFQVEKVDIHGIQTKALTRGLLKSYQGVHFPGVPLGVQAPTEKDLLDFEFGMKEGVDFIALSFVRRAQDLEKLRKKMKGHIHAPLLISKIEQPEAIQYLDEILEASDGTLVARGDLGLSVGLQEVPMLQKKIIRRAAYFGKPVITATQMLESMMEKENPTRAEVSDVANSVLDGTDAVLLSGETAMGNFPIEATRFMSQILQTIEKENTEKFANVGNGDTSAKEAFALAEAARDISQIMGIDRIVPFTYSGTTALRISKFRPNAWIIAMTPQEEVRRKMTLFWGVQSVLIKMISSTDAMFHIAEREIKKLKTYGKSKNMILMAGIPFKKSGITNLLKIHRI